MEIKIHNPQDICISDMLFPYNGSPWVRPADEWNLQLSVPGRTQEGERPPTGKGGTAPERHRRLKAEEAVARGKLPPTNIFSYIFNSTFNIPGFLEYSNASIPSSIENSFEIIGERSGL
jgi:hypothetical protein